MTKTKNYNKFPIGYGDDGGSLNKLWIKKTRIIFPSIIGVSMLPSIANALDGAALLKELEGIIAAYDETKPVTRKISPVGAASCIVAGMCMREAKMALAGGNVPTAVAFTCGAAIAVCGDRVASNYGY
jgi:hypothetical protein